MPFLLDTNVLIHLRDGDPNVSAKVADLKGAVLMSIVSRVELEGGAYRDPAQVRPRRDRLDVMLEVIPLSCIRRRIRRNLRHDSRRHRLPKTQAAYRMIAA
ncbi:MAG: VapC toxin family domain ribonuclease [Myxococcales bacterium]|nr:VapC toxin family domain ribonuclease [Myxococcales bacterium]